jgi:hypothetical protein
MRLLVCGGRDYDDEPTMFAILDRVHAKRAITLLIHGGGGLADETAGCWAASRGIPIKVYRADWKTHGRSAGPIRNQQMIDEGKPDGGIGFPGGDGTSDMLRRLRSAGLPVWEPIV